MLFVPRQVALASLPAAAAAAAAMAKEEPRKEKKRKSKAAAKGSAAPDARRAAVVASVAAFLESSGFPRTLAALLSEANLEGDAWRSSPVRLEDLVSKFLDSSNSAPGVSVAVSNEQEKTADAVVEGQYAGKKNKKKKGGAEVCEPESKPNEPSAPEKPSENADDETKEKKRKKKKDGSSVANDGRGEADETVKTDDQKLDGKKKKSKKHEKDADVEARLEKVELAVKNKFEATEKLKEDGKRSREEESKSQNDGADKNGLGDGAPLDKGKKKKKGKSTSEASDKIDAGTATPEVEGKSEVANENGEAVVNGKDDNEKKSKKKRKKSSSEENVLVEDKQVAGKDSVPKPDHENKSGMDIDKGEDGRPSTDNAVVSKKRKLEEVEGSTLPAIEDSTANQKLNNGFAEDDTKEHSTISKPSKRQKLSSEPKTVIAFQRVKLDDVKFADERLQDNSYWAKGGADSGYGAKAQEILGQVRGRGFRHEKTKKKRGTYRGGLIDLQTHSIKFDNSDDE